MLIDMLERPAAAEEILDFTLEVAIKVSMASLESGAHGLMFGEATCSPNFISPAMYRRLVQPRHKLLMNAVREMGWQFAGLHVCGDISPILEDLIATGAGLIDVDHQVDASSAIRQARGRVALRGNLDPVTAFFQGSAEEVRRQTGTLIQTAGGARWILSSGCDIPPGTPAENVEAFCRAAGVCPP
jgi:MtaA/CmuA family methyltransferase